MMAVQFESSADKKLLREERRKARQEDLDRAKAEYDKAKWREEQAKKRGEDTWMLPSISDRIDKEEKAHAKDKKKKLKKEKKHKKSKKKKKHKKAQSESNSDSEDEPEWAESTCVAVEGRKTEQKPSAHQITPKLERESWMEAPPELLPTMSRSDQRLLKEKQLEEERNKLIMEPGKHPKELNPFWKDGGLGLPANEVKPPTNISGNIAGDAGYSWLKKAYDRCVEQAKEDGKTLEEVAADRYGSLEELESKIAQAKRSQEASSGSRHRSAFHRPGLSRHERDESYQSRRRGDTYKEKDYRRDGKETHSERDDSRDRFSKMEDKDPQKASRQEYRPSERNKSRSFMRPSNDDTSGSDRRRMPFRKPGSEDDYSYSSRSQNDDRESRTDRMKMTFRKPDSSDETSYISSTRSSTEKKDDSARWKKKPVRPDQGNSDQSAKQMELPKLQGHPSKQTLIEKSESSSSETDSSDIEDELTASPEQVQLLSEQEMNEIGAKIVKAEIMGDDALAKQLKERIESARNAAKANPKALQTSVIKKRRDEDDDEVLLTRTDRSGMTRPLPGRQFPVEPKGGRRKKQKIATHENTGERKSYFDDDDKFDLKTLVEREKMGTAEDSNMMFARLAGRCFEKTDEEHQLDDVFMQRASKIQSESKQEDREKQMAVLEHKKRTTAMENCKYCFENVAKHLIVAIGRKVYLSLPNHKSMAEGHCLIVPMQHVAQSTVLDEDVWDEVQAFRRCLTQMFQERDEDCVFMETSMALHKMPHMAIECVPMPREVGDMAPIYYKKALMEAESEWAQNKKVIDLSKKNIKNAIPKGFPYFSVDFGLQGGFAHIIEDDKTFPWYFGREVCGGMMDLEPGFWRKPHKENFDSSRRKVLEFEKMWKPHDWTQSLKLS